MKMLRIYRSIHCSAREYIAFRGKPPLPIIFHLRYRMFGGYIEDAQLSMLGHEIYKEVNGSDAIPEDFVIPWDSVDYPSSLWGYALGKSVAIHLSPGSKMNEKR